MDILLKQDDENYDSSDTSSDEEINQLIDIAKK